MSDFENRVFNCIEKPTIYLIYVDDILILANNINEINILQNTFQKNQFLTLLMNQTKAIKFSFYMFLLIFTIIITSQPPLTKKPLL